ncbi:NAD(P)/FAD-dependent oxidoreductase [Streptomyces zhihengii]|uniref:Tryptophan 7-halogenase n=1 Tax=Streptomyces zhihengii TaxID=1818004 RepID=A0ABS2UMD0_9ACTN|nr:tryptophan 7-halogenase [Streptomyces zhihengii]MBM9618503.1 tryptophan 7-halogenase [Streptomyces zhihengii]
MVLGKHAVVVGGSVAGLTAAGALAGRFERVTVLDRDALPSDAANRKGVPQARHSHALLIGGRLALEKVFPGLTAELTAGGAVPWDPGNDLLFHQMGAFRIPYSTGMMGVSLTRAYLEHSLRRRVGALPNAVLRDNAAVTQVVGVPGRVTGVQLDDGEVIEADLVVDATGRSDRGDRWLEQVGCQAPEVDTVKIDVGYSSRMLHRTPGDRLTEMGGLLFLMASIGPNDKRAAAAFAVEDDRWIITLGGWHRSYAPTDPDGFAAFAAGLPTSHMKDLLARSEPVDPGNALRYTYPNSRRRYFERLRRPPAGYVAIGDAVCSFNPLYGQGMTVAILEALELGDSLDRCGGPTEEMTRTYFRAVGKLLEMPWRISVAGDFIFPETVGPKAFGTDVANWYVGQVTRASHTSVDVHRVMLEVQQMLAPPSALLRPGVIARSLRAARRSPAVSSRPGAVRSPVG